MSTDQLAELSRQAHLSPAQAILDAQRVRKELTATGNHGDARRCAEIIKLAKNKLVHD